jgi:hypothetical protein
MDFIEKLLHISPDGGNGLTEAALLGVFLTVLAVSVWKRMAGRRAAAGVRRK